jgi:monoterpene epsilon-lactone hydrolase
MTTRIRMSAHSPRLLLALFTTMVPLAVPAEDTAKPPQKVIVDQDGLVHIPAFAVPLSRYMSEEAKRSYMNQRLRSPSLGPAADVAGERTTLDREFYAPLVAQARALYAVNIEERHIAGIRADVVTPREGLAPRNRNRVLITLHGGGFRVGAGLGGLLQAIPIAGVGKMTVISIDYRQGPEYKFPAASEDVAVVYRELLKHYKPRNIGLYGSSAGATLTAMSMAWFQKEHLPNPGAIGLLCESATGGLGGDSSIVAVPLNPRLGTRQPPPLPNAQSSPDPTDYLGNASLQDPLVAPALHPAVLAGFPPTLVITGTRDEGLSDVVYTHTQLVKAGVDAELHVWDGMWHSFFFDTSLPESKEEFAVVTRFFDRHLGH